MEPQKALEKLKAEVIERNLRELSGGSDRACGIVAGALIDDALLELLDGKGSRSDLYVKINLARERGLISSKLRDDMHLIRQIRNEFSHASYECTFQTDYVKTRISELATSFGEQAKRMYAEASAQSEEPDRSRFTLYALLILAALTVRRKATSGQTEAAEEEIYA